MGETTVGSSPPPAPTATSSRLSRRRALREVLVVGSAVTAATAGARPGRVSAQDAGTPAAQPASPVAGGTVALEWLGWSHFRLTSPNGTVVLLNPWVEGNPDATIGLDDIDRVDLILASQGHPDDMGNAVELAIRTGAIADEPFELGTWMIAQGVPEDQVRRGGQGGRLQLDGITVRMVNTVHGSSVDDPNLPTVGLSAGFVVTFENGWTVYFDGNSAATQDMALWARLYQPHAMLLNLNPGREPLDAAAAVALTATDNPNPATVSPHHRRLDPPAGATTIDEVQAALEAEGIARSILAAERGTVYPFS